MTTMVFIGIFVAVTRFCMQYKEMKDLPHVERLRIALVYVVGMIAAFGCGSYLIDWTKAMALPSVVQTALFVTLFTAVFFHCVSANAPIFAEAVYTVINMPSNLLGMFMLLKNMRFLHVNDH